MSTEERATPEAAFAAEIRNGVSLLKRRIAYNPAYFIRMVGEHGPIEASRRLVTSSKASDGFTKLWEHRMLEHSVEALVILPRYSSLFGSDVVAAAERRLRDYGFDVDDYLERRSAP